MPLLKNIFLDAIFYIELITLEQTPDSTVDTRCTHYSGESIETTLIIIWHNLKLNQHKRSE